MAYAETRAVIIDHTKVAGNLTDYPLLISGIYPYLATVANGGSIENAITVVGRNTPADLIFTATATGVVALKFEVEYYSSTTGQFVAWVKVPSVSSSVDTIIYMRYGDAAVNTWQGDIPGTWRSEYKGVWHLATVISATPDCQDSTANGNDGTPSGIGNEVGVPCQIDGGSQFSGGGDGITCTVSDPSLEVQSSSVGFWVNSTSIGGFGSNQAYMTETDPTNTTTQGWCIVQFHDGTLRLKYGTQVYYTSFTLSINTWYFIVVTFDTATGSLKVYKDGVLAQTITGTPEVLVYSSDITHIGGPNTGGLGDQTFASQVGYLDECRIYSGILPTGWIATEYANQFSPSTFYSITAVGTPFTVSCGNPPDGVAGELYTHTFPVPSDGGVAPFFGALLDLNDDSFVPENVFNNLTLSPISPIWTLSGYPAAPGVYHFRLVVVDTVSTLETADCTITIAEGTPVGPPEDWLPVPPVGVPDGTHGWDFSGACAHEGSLGLRHRADGTDEVANSRVAALSDITVIAGQILYAAFWAKSSGSADGSIGLGFMFYDEDDVFLSEEFVMTDSFPTVFTQFKGTITVPTGAVRATPMVQTIGHLTGTWCIDDVYAIFSGGHFVLSSIKHYFDNYTAYR